MRIKWKKTILFFLIGELLIFFGLLRCLTGSFSVSSLWEPIKYKVPANLIESGANGYEIRDNVFRAEIDDAGITLAVPQWGYIDYINLSVKSKSELSNNTQIYYTAGREFTGGNYVEATLHKGNIEFQFDVQRMLRNIRIDLTSACNEQVEIEVIEIFYDNYNKILFIIFCPILMLIYAVVISGYINRRYFWERIINHNKWGKRAEAVEQVCSLAVSDFQARFSGSYLGMFWGIIQPLSTILLFWFVFQIGFRSNPIDDVPFILWLAAGMIPWNYFYDSWFGGTTAFTSYNYIVKKVVFRVEMLPMVKVLSSAILNAIFNIILLIIYVLYGRFPGLHIFDMLYYSFCVFVLSLGLTYFTATLNVFMKDIGQFLGIILQFLMWLTPMMWVYTTIPEKFSFFYKLNPLHYVINGYRESLINGYWFFHNYTQMIWFWIVTIFLLLTGHRLMKRLKSHFADVL